jgi:uncharacterized membrane protein
MVDRMLSRVPLLKPIYTAWKQVLITPGGGEGVFSKVVLIPADDAGASTQLGFCAGQPVDGDPNTMCVFVPAAPNPINGRLYFVQKDNCQFLDVPAEEAFKMILSTGNYVPGEIASAKNPAPLQRRGDVAPAN